VYNKIAGLIFPAFTMLTLSVLAMFGLFGEGDVNKSFFILGLIIIFPLTFLVQGISCAMNHMNPFIALLVSYIAFAIVVITFLNSSAWVYSIYYLVFWIVGFFGAKAIRKWRNRQK
jgi:hypothetical protein